MRTTPTEYRHLVLDGTGTACIEGTRMKVRLLVLQQAAHGWSPEELKWQFPSLGMAQIHAALAYYYDHQAEMDEATRQELEAERADAAPPFTRVELEGRLRG